MVFRINRRSLKYAPKEFSKVNACAWDPPWCFKNLTIFQTTQINYSRQPRVIRTVFSAAPCSFNLQTTESHVTTSSWIKIFFHSGPELAFTVVTWYTNCCIPIYISAPNKEITLFFCSTIVYIVFSFINICTLHEFSFHRFICLSLHFSLFIFVYYWIYACGNVCMELCVGGRENTNWKKTSNWLINSNISSCFMPRVLEIAFIERL